MKSVGDLSSRTCAASERKLNSKNRGIQLNSPSMESSLAGPFREGRACGDEKTRVRAMGRELSPSEGSPCSSIQQSSSAGTSDLGGEECHKVRVM